MNRWLVRHFVRIRNRVVEHGHDRGQGAMEYLGLAVVIAVIIGVLSTTSIGDAILTAILNKISAIAGA
ncbi:hypothetical protein OG552_23215 [Streptomyces sp. NBC_01476]|uniref:hypothetical protein n=1 Tax=Streptomyces sp. NBC_01476 TaxID=2903881 RepID=UPI002E32DB62|nr:hypothetical protein [Streptomyces sp. NBC_01476]